MTTLALTEIWKDIPGFGGHYQASSLGRIRSKDRVVLKRHKGGKVMSQVYSGRLLSPSKASKIGHLSVHLGVNGKKYTASVHGLVLFAFAGPRPEGMECCHNNGNASDNRPDNLRWDTHHNNNGDRKKHGTYALGERHHMAKISNEAAADIYRKLKTGRGVASLSREYGISAHVVYDIKHERHGALKVLGIVRESAQSR